MYLLHVRAQIFISYMYTMLSYMRTYIYFFYIHTCFYVIRFFIDIRVSEVVSRRYDVTKFAGVHPGGTQILLEYAGKDDSGLDDFKAESDLRNTPRFP